MVVIMVNDLLTLFIADNIFDWILVSKLHFRSSPHRGCLFGRYLALVGQQLRLGKHSRSLYDFIEIQSLVTKFLVNIRVVNLFSLACRWWYYFFFMLRDILNHYVEWSVYDWLQTISRQSTTCLLRCLVQCRLKLTKSSSWTFWCQFFNRLIHI